MRFVLVPALILFTAIAHGADDSPKASRTLDGVAVQFPKKSMEEGVKVTLGLLRSCSSETVPSKDTVYSKDDLKKAKAGDHFHLVFSKSQTVTVMDAPVEVTELVVSSGAIWVRSGEKVRRFAKYEFKKWQAFEGWLRNAATVK